MEAAEQAKLIRWCRDQGLVVRKLTSSTRRGWPDVFVASPHTKRVMFLEMKAPGGRLSLPQRRTIAELARCDIYVGVPLSFATAKRLVINELGLDRATI